MLSEKMKVTENELCTGCGACVVVCPTKALQLVTNVKGELYSEIDADKCIKCNKCRKICPQNVTIKSNMPRKAFVAWSQEKSIRQEAASGGVASALYKYFASQKVKFAGVKIDENMEAVFKVGSSLEDICDFRGSKYVFSNLFLIISEIMDLIKKKEKVLFIGLPCQVAALKKITNFSEFLVCIDIVCHGVCSSKYLKEHIKAVAKEKTVSKILFRDPQYGTNNFVFSLFEGDKRIYKKGVDKSDVYQLAYHKALSYRENCYNCRYAKNERISDITIGDYQGLGTASNYKGERNDVSLVLCNTERGEKLLENLVKDDYIFAEERPVFEPLKTEPQLNHPSVKSELCVELNEKIEQTGQFELSARKVLREKIILNYLIPVSLRRKIRKLLRWYLYYSKGHINIFKDEK